MKNHLLLSAAALLASATLPLSANANDELVKTLYSDEAKNVTWETPLEIDKSLFDDEVISVGNYILINLENATDVLEIKDKEKGTWLPGSRLTNIEGASEYKAYITTDMLAALKGSGLQITGKEFTVTSVSIMNDGFIMPEGAIWGGYFWVDNWNTLEIFKTAFDNYNYASQRYLNIYLSSDNGDNTGYFMKVLTQWENPDAVWADNDQIKHATNCATVDLEDIDIQEALKDVTTLMIQSNPEGGNPYNLTAVTLTDAPIASRIETVFSTESKTPSVLYNLQGIAVATDVTPADLPTLSLPAGIYVMNGHKYAIR